MSTEIDAKLVGFVDDLDKEGQEKGLEALRRCNFSAQDDPILGLLAVMRLRANRVSRSDSDKGASERLTRVEELLWRLEGWKRRNLVLSWVIVFILGMGLSLGAMAGVVAKFPNSIRGWLQYAPDARILTLERNLVSWNVNEREGNLAIGVAAVDGRQMKVRPMEGGGWIISVPTSK